MNQTLKKIIFILIVILIVVSILLVLSRYFSDSAKYAPVSLPDNQETSGSDIYCTSLPFCSGLGNPCAGKKVNGACFSPQGVEGICESQGNCFAGLPSWGQICSCKINVQLVEQ